VTYSHPVPIDTDAVPCRKDPERQFPNGSGAAREAQEHAAKAVCRFGNNGRACPLLVRCLSYGIQYAVEGVWGATTEKERQDIRDATGTVPISITPGMPRATVYRRTA
jgi:hypothetical protein